MPKKPKLKPLEDDPRTREFVEWYKKLAEERKVCPSWDFERWAWTIYWAVRTPVWQDHREALEMGIQWRLERDWKETKKVGLTLKGLLAKREGKPAGYMTELAERGEAMLTPLGEMEPPPKPPPPPPKIVKHLFRFKDKQVVFDTVRERYGFVQRDTETITWMDPIKPLGGDYYFVFRDCQITEARYPAIEGILGDCAKQVREDWKRISEENRIIGTSDWRRFHKIKRQQAREVQDGEDCSGSDGRDVWR